jgi:putative ATP-dependent endonuclease of the OLD family
MRLASITVEKYRSITSARKIQLQDQTILVGPNKEGKSNILRALVTGMSMLTSGICEARVGLRGPRPVIRYSTRHPYDWTYDFPVHLQERQPNGQSVIVLEFEPTPNELAEFREEIKSRLSGTIPLRLTFGPRDVSVTVSKQGRG